MKKSRCSFCKRDCFESVPSHAPIDIALKLKKYNNHFRLRTCSVGREYDKKIYNYCWVDVQ